MKRHIFKAGDGVVCQSSAEVRRLLCIAYNHGYQVYSPSLHTSCFHFIFTNTFGLIGTALDSMETAYSTKEFLFLVSQFEKGDKVKLLGSSASREEYIATVLKDVERQDFNDVPHSYRLITNDYLTHVDQVKLHKDVSEQKNNQNNTNMNNQEDEIVIIPTDLLREGYKSANVDQRLEIERYVNSFTGEVSKKHLQAFYERLNCTGWKTKLEICFPFLKETENIVIKYGEKADDKKLFGGFGMISPRSSGSLRERSFYLSYKYNWSLQKDNEGAICLVPTRK